MKLAVIRLTLGVFGPLWRRGWLPALHERLRLGELYRTDLVQWRVEAARRMGAKVGRGCRFYSLNMFSEPYLIEIGDDVIVSGNVTFVTHDGGIYLMRGEIPNVQGHYGRIKIGNNCFIGMGAIILPNVQIGNNCVVAAGAVVSRSFGDNCVIMGNPAKSVLSFGMYKSARKSSPGTVLSEEYPFPTPMPEELRRALLERHLRDLPPPAARPAQTASASRDDTPGGE